MSPTRHWLPVTGSALWRLDLYHRYPVYHPPPIPWRIRSVPGSSPYTTIAQIDKDAPEWLASLRRRGLGAWSSASMPGSKDEDWKYVDIDFELDDFRPVTEPSGQLGSDAYLEALSGASGWVTMVDGSVVAAEGDEVTVAGVLDVPDERIALRYGTAVPPGIDIFAAANHAFAPPGAVIDPLADCRSTLPLRRIWLSRQPARGGGGLLRYPALACCLGVVGEHVDRLLPQPGLRGDTLLQGRVGGQEAGCDITVVEYTVQELQLGGVEGNHHPLGRCGFRLQLGQVSVSSDGAGVTSRDVV